MSETALTIIKAAMRVVGVLASGETPTADESADGLEAMKFMFRHWSSKNIRLYFVTKDTLTLTGASSYTIGTGGTINTLRPTSIRGAIFRQSDIDYPMEIIDEDKYRRFSMKSFAGDPGYIWYSPEYPLGKVYPWPIGGSGTIYLDSMKPLVDPTAITSSISFPPEYDEAIKYQLAVRLAAEYGRTLPQEVVALAATCLDDIESRNFASQINSVRPEVIRLAQGRYNIDGG